MINLFCFFVDYCNEHPNPRELLSDGSWSTFALFLLFPVVSIGDMIAVVVLLKVPITFPTSVTIWLSIGVVNASP